MISASAKTRGGWHPLWLFAGSLAVFVLFGSWIGQHWRAADDAVFHYFNAQFQQGSLISFGAIANWRPFDTVAAVIAAGLELAGAILKLGARPIAMCIRCGRRLRLLR